ncbi:hypothetical protein D3C75_657840 [compost metagenome]
MHQLAAIAAGDIGDHEVLYRLIFRVGVIICAPRKANADAPVNFAVGTVDMVDNVVRNQDIAIVNRHVPLDSVALQIAKVAVSDGHPVHLGMKALAQNCIVGFRDGQLVDQQVTHHLWFFTADIDLGHRAITAHRQPLDYAVGAAHVQRDIFGAPLPFADHLAAVLQHQPPSSVAGHRTANMQRFAFGDENSGIDVIAGQSGRHHHRVAFGKSLLKGRDPVTTVVLANVHRATRSRGPHAHEGSCRQYAAGSDKRAARHFFRHTASV